MSESTAAARCTKYEFRAARAAGLLVLTSDDEMAIHAFAESIRKKTLDELAQAIPSRLEVTAQVMRGEWMCVDQSGYDEYTSNGWIGRKLHDLSAIAKAAVESA